MCRTFKLFNYRCLIHVFLADEVFSILVHARILILFLKHDLLLLQMLVLIDIQAIVSLLISFSILKSSYSFWRYDLGFWDGIVELEQVAFILLVF